MRHGGRLDIAGVDWSGEWESRSYSDSKPFDDLHTPPFRADGATYGAPTWIWSVVVDGRLFVRAWNGKGTR